MLPTTTQPHGAATPVAEFARRMVHFRQMDFEYATWTMVHLCTNPSRAYRTALYSSRTKHQWARDDPAFVVVLLYLLLVSTVAWSLAFADRSPLSMLQTFAYVACVDFAAVGIVLATVAWWVANNFLQDETPALSALSGAGRDLVEWRYAFDVHCNAFLPMMLLLHAAQYMLLPVLDGTGYIPALLSDSLFATAFAVYHYLIFLGFSELPFIKRAELFLYPIVLVLLALVLAVPLQVNATRIVVYVYFG